MNDLSRGISEPLVLSLAGDCARFSLRACAEDVQTVAEALGWPLPTRIGGLTKVRDKLALCLGPDEWQLLVPEDEAAPLTERVASLGPRIAVSLVDIGSREIGVEIMGPLATSALCAACAFDVEGMAAGGATRTILDRVPIILVKHSATQYRIEVWRSFAPHVWKLLETVKRELALAI